MLESRAVEATPCPDCGTEVAGHFLVCPGCHRLVHSDRLKELAAEATFAEQSGAPVKALVAWRSALDLLPPGSKQAEMIRAKVEALTQVVDASPGQSAGSGEKKGWAGRAAGLGTVGLLILTKGKLLLLGLTKASTFFSMFAMMGVYWTLWGWRFAVGIVLSIYVHEMGHVAALMRYGIKADAPMFIPGLGAVIRARQKLASPREDARVGLAGPVWGLGAALACAGGYAATGWPALAGIAQFGAIINLFNLIPIWQLDGGRAFSSLTRQERWISAIAAVSLWAATENEFLLLLAMAAAYRAGFTKPSDRPDRPTLIAYVALLALLSLLLMLPTGVR